MANSKDPRETVSTPSTPNAPAPGPVPAPGQGPKPKPKTVRPTAQPTDDTKSTEEKKTATIAEKVGETQVKPVVSTGEKEQKEQKVPILNPESKKDLICPYCKKKDFKNKNHYDNCVKKCKEEKKQAEAPIAVGGRKTVKLRLKKKNRTIKKYN